MGMSHHYRVDGESGQGLFIGVGIDRYTSPDLPNLSGSADEVQTIAELVGDHFGTRILRDPDEATVQRELRDSAGQFPDNEGSAVLMWSGHGVPGASANTLRLLAHDSRNDPSEGFDAVDVASRVAATGANQILLIIDTCYAGNAVDAVVQIYNHFRVNPPAGEWCWFGRQPASIPSSQSCSLPLRLATLQSLHRSPTQGVRRVGAEPLA
jgi:Caspase domain